MNYEFIFIFASVKSLRPGSGRWNEAASVPSRADAPHFAMTPDEAATVYITGFGPTDTRTRSAPRPIPVTMNLQR
jgi:hypothetical protein